MAVHQKRISAAIVDALDDGGDDAVDDPLETKSVKKLAELKPKIAEPKVTVVTPQLKTPVDEKYESSESTNSDLRDVLNCIRDSRDIKHLCHISCPRLKKEECKVYKAAPYSNEDYEAQIDYEYSQLSYGDYDLMGVKPVRIPLVHVKGCVHERESKVDFQQESPESCKWCYCEDQGTSDEEAHYNDQVYEKFRDPNDVGFLKLSPPKPAPVDETGLIDWKNIPQDSDLQDILNCIFPPKVFTVNGQVWIQEVNQFYLQISSLVVSIILSSSQTYSRKLFLLL